MLNWMTRTRRPLLTAAAMIAVVLCSACPQQDQSAAHAPQADAAPQADTAQSRPLYMVTVTPLKLILDPVVATRAQVKVLLPAGASAHTYEPRPSDLQQLSASTALLWVGAGFDGWAAELGAPASIELLKLVPPELQLDMEQNRMDDAAKPAGAQEEGSSKAPAELDPHFFTDPLAVAEMLPALAAELSRLDPAGAEAYQRNADAFGVKLLKIHQELDGMLADCGGKAVILFHPSFGYFLDRYAMNLAGVIEEFPGKEPSPKDLQNIATFARQLGVRALLSETLLPRPPAEAVAEACGLPLYELDPGCGAGRSYRDYRDWLLYNAGIIKAAVLGTPPPEQ